MAKTAIIFGSLAVHAALGIGLFANGVWKLERLTGERRPTAVGLMAAPPEASGAPAALPAQTIVPKRKLVTETVQPMVLPPAPETPAASTGASETGTGTGTGTGDGDGDGEGDGDGPPGGGGECALPPCAAAPPAAPIPPRPPAVTQPQMLAPSVLKGLRIAGDVQIQPDDLTKTQILRDGRERVTASLKVCIARDGSVSSAAMIASSKYAGYDERLTAAARRWRYQPYTVNGAPVPACGVVTFQYSIK